MRVLGVVLHQTALCIIRGPAVVTPSAPEVAALVASRSTAGSRTPDT